MGSPVQALLQDPQFQALSPDGQRKAVRGVGGSDFASISDLGIDKFMNGVRSSRATQFEQSRIPQPPVPTYLPGVGAISDTRDILHGIGAFGTGLKNVV